MSTVQESRTHGSHYPLIFFFLFISFPHIEQEEDWQTKVSTILKFVRQLTSILSTQIEAPTIALRLFLLSAQIADECGFEDLTYDLYVQAFSVYEDSISESRAQLQAITLIIGTLAGAKVFGVDNYDTLITKAALHGAKLLKKSHQATAVGLASHLWWQEASPISDADGDTEAGEKKETTEKAPVKEEGGEASVKAVCIIRYLPDLQISYTYSTR